MSELCTDVDENLLIYVQKSYNRLNHFLPLGPLCVLDTVIISCCQNVTLVISDNQFGFEKKSSCSHAIYSLRCDINLVNKSCVINNLHKRWLTLYCFYTRKQMLLSARLSCRILSVCPSVCLSVRPSHGWISQKRCKLESSNLYRRLRGKL